MAELCLLAALILGIGAAPTLLGRIESDPDLSASLELLQSPGYEDLLLLLGSDAHTTTVFLPTDTALAYVKSEGLPAINPEIMSYHFSDGETLVANHKGERWVYVASELNDATYVNLPDAAPQVFLLNGRKHVLEDGLPRVNWYRAQLETQDANCSNGVLQTVSAVLYPPGPLTHTLERVGFSKFLQLLNQTNKLEEFNAMRGVTVFAPTDEALRHVLPLSDKDALDLVNMHITRQVLYLTDATEDGEKFKTLSGDFVNVTNNEGDAFNITNVSVVYPNILIRNGVVHGVSAVLHPASDVIWWRWLVLVMLVILSFCCCAFLLHYCCGKNDDEKRHKRSVHAYGTFEAHDVESESKPLIGGAPDRGFGESRPGSLTGSARGSQGDHSVSLKVAPDKLDLVSPAFPQIEDDTCTDVRIQRRGSKATEAYVIITGASQRSCSDAAAAITRLLEAYAGAVKREASETDLNQAPRGQIDIELSVDPPRASPSPRASPTKTPKKSPSESPATSPATSPSHAVRIHSRAASLVDKVKGAAKAVVDRGRGRGQPVEQVDEDVEKEEAETTEMQGSEQTSETKEDAQAERFTVELPCPPEVQERVQDEFEVIMAEHEDVKLEVNNDIIEITASTLAEANEAKFKLSCAIRGEEATSEALKHEEQAQALLLYLSQRGTVAALRKIYEEFPHVRTVKKVFDDANHSGNGSVSRDEFKHSFVRLLPSQRVEDADWFFNRVDDDGNGSITWAEFLFFGLKGGFIKLYKDQPPMQPKRKGASPSK